jgi:hypothetical protein
MVLARRCGRLAMIDPLRSKLGVVRVPPKGIKGGWLILLLIPFGESKARCGFQGGGVVCVCVCVDPLRSNPSVVRVPGDRGVEGDQRKFVVAHTHTRWSGRTGGGLGSGRRDGVLPMLTIEALTPLTHTRLPDLVTT